MDRRGRGRGAAGHQAGQPVCLRQPRVLARRREPGGRGSLYDAREIARLARKGRPRRAPAGAELVIESAVTEITPSTLRYRGHDVMELAGRRSFEEVALLLWGGDPAADAGGWQATPAALAVGRAAQAALPPRILPLERLQVIVPALAATDPLRLQLDQPAVIAAGRALIAGMVDCLPAPRTGGRRRAGGDPDHVACGYCCWGGSDRTFRPVPQRPDSGVAAGSIAGRLTRALSPAQPPAGLARAVQTALVLLADHELAASTLAARVAASVRADPYAVVATGLGAVGGALHGGASLAAETMLELGRRARRRAARGRRPAPPRPADPGLRPLRVPGRRPAIGLAAAGHRRSMRPPRRGWRWPAPWSPRRGAGRCPSPTSTSRWPPWPAWRGLVPGAGEAIFAVARTAGWIAHALEEYDRGAPIRPRGVYTGPAARITVGE